MDAVEFSSQLQKSNIRWYLLGILLAVELLVSRFVRLAVTEGLNLSLSLEEDPASSALATGEQGNSPAYDPGAPQN